jgi:hypothetical protein
VSGPRRGLNGMGELPGWAELESVVPQVAATMCRYLARIGCVLRPGSVENADQALRCFAAFLTQAAPEVAGIGPGHLRGIPARARPLAALGAVLSGGGMVAGLR